MFGAFQPVLSIHVARLDVGVSRPGLRYRLQERRLGARD